MSPSLLGSLSVPFVLCLPLCLVEGCKSQEKQEKKETKRACDDALDGAHVDVKDGLLDAARRKLRVAEANCPERRRPYVDQLRAEIATKTAQVAEQARRETEEKKRRREQPIVPFMEWVSKWSVMGTDRGEVTCYDRAHPSFGWCDARRTVPTEVEFHARFQRAEPEAIRFSTSVSMPLVCDDVGEHRVVRKWEARTEGGNSVQRTHCELAEKGHRGQSVLISVFPDHSEVDVFNQSYLNHDAKFADRVRREGR